jgi:hypothetical protein
MDHFNQQKVITSFPLCDSGRCHSKKKNLFAFLKKEKGKIKNRLEKKNSQEKTLGTATSVRYLSLGNGVPIFRTLHYR